MASLSIGLSIDALHQAVATALSGTTTSQIDAIISSDPARCKATVGIMINRGYYAKGPEWDYSLGPQPRPRSLAFVLTAMSLFCSGTVQAYFYLKGSPLEPALTDLLVLVPWTYAGVIVIDGYHVPYYKRRLGLL